MSIIVLPQKRSSPRYVMGNDPSVLNFCFLWPIFFAANKISCNKSIIPVSVVPIQRVLESPRKITLLQRNVVDIKISLLETIHLFVGSLTRCEKRILRRKIDAAKKLLQTQRHRCEQIFPQMLFAGKHTSLPSVSLFTAGGLFLRLQFVAATKLFPLKNPSNEYNNGLRAYLFLLFCLADQTHTLSLLCGIVATAPVTVSWLSRRRKVAGKKGVSLSPPPDHAL